MIKVGKIKGLQLKKVFPHFEQEKQKAIVKLGNALVEELFILSSGEAVHSVTGALRRSIYIIVMDNYVEVGYDIQKAPHARKFKFVVQLAWDNVYGSPIFKNILKEFRLKAFR